MSAFYDGLLEAKDQKKKNRAGRQLKVTAGPLYFWGWGLKIFHTMLPSIQRTVTSTKIMAASVWNFFSPPPLAPLAQELYASARKSCCVFCFRARAHVCTESFSSRGRLAHMVSS